MHRVLLGWGWYSVNPARVVAGSSYPVVGTLEAIPGFARGTGLSVREELQAVLGQTKALQLRRTKQLGTQSRWDASYPLVLGCEPAIKRRESPCCDYRFEVGSNPTIRRFVADRVSGRTGW